MHYKELIGSKAILDLSVGDSTEVTISNKNTSKYHQNS